MNITDILWRAAHLESRDIFVLLSHRHIGVESTPEPPENGGEAFIVGTDYGTRIVLGPNKDEKHREFILWHELGHFEIDAPSENRRNFLVSEKRKEHEMEANIFAVFALLPKTCPPGENLFTVAKKRGIPYEILRDVLYRIRIDSNPVISNYYDSYYI